ncbi:MAG: DUF2922 domain-containing protein [Clostridiales bacterium]|jgi:hypothetical protein|nr:DUF2922 domain-containing protein [Clostridiales bacterium]
MEIRDFCVLTFDTEYGKRKSISVNDPRPNLNNSDIEFVADAFFNANIFEETIGRLTNLVRAAVVTETTATIV